MIFPVTSHPRNIMFPRQKCQRAALYSWEVRVTWSALNFNVSINWVWHRLEVGISVPGVPAMTSASESPHLVSTIRTKLKLKTSRIFHQVTSSLCNIVSSSGAGVRLQFSRTPVASSGLKTSCYAIICCKETLAPNCNRFLPPPTLPHISVVKAPAA